MKGQPFKKFFGIVKQVAPTLLQAAGGPAGALAGTIAKRVLGNEAMSDAQLEEAVATATGTTDGLAKLRAVEAELQKAELDNGFKFADLEVGDRKDARALASGRSLAPWLALTCLFIGGYFAILTFVLWRVFYSPPDSMPDVALLTIASTLLGVLTGEVPRIMAWWFGSSQGSSAKTDVLAEAMRGIGKQ